MEMIQAGTRLSGRYEILGEVGVGGMGEVYSARDLRLGRDVAVKILPARLAAEDAALHRFEQEAKALAALSHPNILTIHDFDSDEGITFAVMELLKGENLRKRMKAPMPWEKVVEIAYPTTEGLAAAHSRGIIHRDLKPENIFITEAGEVKILDFGLARIEGSLTEAYQSTAPTTPLHTQPGTVVGTVMYMSPEQLRGETIDARSDLFSFGLILYEMLTGVRPFSGNTYAEVIAAILKDDPAPIETQERPPVELVQLVNRCLEKMAVNRYPSARDLSFALKSILAASGSTRETSKQTARPGARKRRKAIDSLAVLPFINAGGDSSMEYLSDGITETIINNLSQLPKLRVMARSTVFRYKGKEIDPQRIGAELGVRAILAGRMVLHGDRFSLQTELVDMEDGSQLWGEHYRRKFSDVFETEEQIAREISQQLRLKLSGEEKKRLTKRHTKNTDAYELYLKGRLQWSKRTADGLRKAIEYFRQATASDPDYALAYAGLSDCYNLMSAYGMMAPRECMPLAEDSALRALNIDPALAEGHEALAHAKMLFDWDWVGTEAGFKRAIELNPNYATAHQRYAIFLLAQGRMDQAEAEMKRAHELDPLSLIINTDVGLVFYFQSKIDSAMEYFRKALELDPQFAVAHYVIGLAYQGQGKYKEAIEAFEKGIKFSGDRTVISAKGHILAISGEHEEARQILAELNEISKERYVSPYRFALIHEALGERDRAFGYLEQAYQERSVWLIHVHLRVDPRFKPLHGDPRFAALLTKMGLPPV